MYEAKQSMLSCWRFCFAKNLAHVNIVRLRLRVRAGVRVRVIKVLGPDWVRIGLWLR